MAETVATGSRLGLRAGRTVLLDARSADVQSIATVVTRRDRDRKDEKTRRRRPATAGELALNVAEAQAAGVDKIGPPLPAASENRHLVKRIQECFASVAD